MWITLIIADFATVLTSSFLKKKWKRKSVDLGDRGWDRGGGIIDMLKMTFKRWRFESLGGFPGIFLHHSYYFISASQDAQGTENGFL